MRFLVEAGADLTVKDRNGKTAWQIAKDKGYIEIVAYLQQAYKERQPMHKKALKKIKSNIFSDIFLTYLKNVKNVC